MKGGKIALISDIHSNLEALEAVLQEIENEKPDKIICLGDIVGYGANPNECCELVRKYCDITVMGNHDAAAVGLMDYNYFVSHAKDAIEWTKNVLTDENAEWLRGLPLTYEEGSFFFSHGAPYSPEDYIYLVSRDTAYWSLRFIEAAGKKASFSGHAHITYVFAITKEGDFAVGAPKEFSFSEFRVICVNVGSVGQPRDGNPKSAFSIIEEDRYRVVRVPYDVELASRKIQNAGLPEILSQRLFLGR